MKENWKKYLLWVAILFASIVLLNVLQDYWMAKGERKVEDYYNEQLTIYVTKTEEGYAEKNRLLENAVKEKLDDRTAHHTEINNLKTDHLKYQEKIRLEFQDIKKEMFSLKAHNRYLKEDILSLRATLLSFSLANKELSLALNEIEIKTVAHYNSIMEASTKAVEEKYINFLEQIDKIKKSKKSWRMIRR